MPLGPDLIFAATDLPDLRLHVEICEDMWVPVPPSAEAALAGATVLSNLSGSPITIARAEDRRLLVRSASFREQRGVRLRRGRSGRVDHRPGLGRPDHGLRVRRPAGGERALPRRAAAHRRRRRPRPDPPGAAAPGHLRRQPRGLGLTVATRRRAAFRTVGFELAPPTGDIGLRRKRRPLSRSCPTTSSGWRWTATRPTTSRSPAWSSGSRRSVRPRP